MDVKLSRLKQLTGVFIFGHGVSDADEHSLIVQFGDIGDSERVALRCDDYQAAISLAEDLHRLLWDCLKRED